MYPKIMDFYYASCQQVKHTIIKSYGGTKIGGFFIYDMFSWTQ